MAKENQDWRLQNKSKQPMINEFGNHNISSLIKTTLFF